MITLNVGIAGKSGVINDMYKYMESLAAGMTDADIENSIDELIGKVCSKFGCTNEGTSMKPVFVFDERPPTQEDKPVVVEEKPPPPKKSPKKRQKKSTIEVVAGSGLIF